MKNFLLKCLIFFGVVISIISFVLIFYGGYVDYFYEKFTTPKAKSMILGDSRSLQGIQPRIINEELQDMDFEFPILNYSFTLAQIAYGKPYLESIKRKLDESSENGLYILSVHPFLLANRTGNHEEKDSVFFEQDMPPHNMTNVTSSPNFEYLLKNFGYFHFRGIFRKSSRTHKDGWLEETNLPSDPNVLEEWKQGQIKLYQRHSKNYSISEVRYQYLLKTIDYLDKFGTVVMARLPVSKEIIQIEKELWPKFSDSMESISDSKNVLYIDFNDPNQSIKTYDGIHIDKFKGVPFTRILCDSIRDGLNKIN